MVNTCLTGNITPSPYVRQYALENSIVYCVYAMHSRSSSLQHNISNWKWVESFLGCCSIFLSITFLLTHRCQYSFWFSHFVKYIPFWIFLRVFLVFFLKKMFMYWCHISGHYTITCWFVNAVFIHLSSGWIRQKVMWSVPPVMIQIFRSQIFRTANAMVCFMLLFCCFYAPFMGFIFSCVYVR